MEIVEIIKDSFIFPTKNLKAIAIYLGLSFVIAVTGGLGVILAVLDGSAFMLICALIFIILAVLTVLVLSGYEINIIKTGIDLKERAPGIDLKNNLVMGIKAVIVSVVCFIVPMIIMLFVAFLTKLPGDLINIAREFNQTAINYNTFSILPQKILAHLFGSMLTIIIVGVILFVLFSFIQYMANARLANTGSLSEALNIIEAVKDISRIGFTKVIVTIILIIAIMLVINGVLSYIYQQVPDLSILNIIVVPFLVLAANRANGLLYSDIA